MGTVYFIVKTALGADTGRKRQMAEIKTALNSAPTERTKNPSNLITPNKTALTIRPNPGSLKLTYILLSFRTKLDAVFLSAFQQCSQFLAKNGIGSAVFTTK